MAANDGCINGDQSIERNHTERNDSKLLSIPKHQFPTYRIEWRRFNRKDSEWILIESNPRPSDVIQGLLGNCWLLSALASVVQYDDSLIEKVIQTTSEEFKQSSRCHIRLFQNGLWHSIIVDDWLPCDRFGRLIFSESKRKQLFVPLIEKAMAKLMGGYHKLIGGHISHGLTALTGYPCQLFTLPESNTKDLEFFAEFWLKILSFHSAKFSLTVSCGRNLSDNVHDRKMQAKHYKQLGLLVNHAYTILDVISIGDSRMLKLRNPWGTLIWKGDRNEAILKEKSPKTFETNTLEASQQGIFFISFIDLCKYFQDLVVCKILPHWFQYCFENIFALSFNDHHNGQVFEIIMKNDDDDQLHNGHCQIMCTLYSQIKSENSHTVLMVLCQLLDNQCFHIIDTFVTASISTVKHGSPAVTCETELKRGRRYLLAVFTFNDNDKITNVLRIHSSRQLRIKIFEPNPALRGDLIIHYVIACGQAYKKKQISTYHLHRQFPGLISLVQNHNSKQWLRVSMEARYQSKCTTNDHYHYSDLKVLQSQHLESNITATSSPSSQSYSILMASRGSFKTIDLIPPGHCQLINILIDSAPYSTPNGDRDIDITMNFRYLSIDDQKHYSNHEPDIRLTYGLHSVRPIIELIKSNKIK